MLMPSCTSRAEKSTPFGITGPVAKANASL
jgi:hypothetical protein